MAKVDMVMPQMGESIAEGTIIRWLKKEGDKVERDEIILEISTDKVDSEIPSPHAGVVKKLLANEGDTVKVGNVIAELDSSESGAEAVEQTSDSPAPSPEPEPEKTEATEQQAKPEPVSSSQKEEKAQPVTTSSQAPVQTEPQVTGNGQRKFYSPLVRSIAKAEGITRDELAQIPGTGAHGRVTKKDLLNYMDSRPATTPSVPTTSPVTQSVPTKPAYTPPAQPEFSDERTEIIPMDTMRKSIAAHMVTSIQTSPHVFTLSEADMTNLVSFRSQNKERFLQATGTKLTYMPFITQACAKALQDYPLVNSSLDGDKIIRKKYINVGIAVALENNGLIVPVIKNADGLNITGMARAINDLANRARSKKLKPDEVQDGTFSITNMGSFGSVLGFPIINQPQVAILGVGAIQKRPVVINDAIAIRSMMYVSLSFDHRLVDGALAGQFLERIAYYLTNFDTSTIL